MGTDGHYHCHVSPISRGQGRSVVASAAYHAAERITNERTGLCHDFTRKYGVLHSEIMVPAGSPVWARNRAVLWNAAERAEDKSTRRSTAKTGREFRLGLAHELSADARLSCVRAFSRFLVDTYGVAVDFSLHAPDRHGDQRNFHAHVLTSTRVMTDAGFAGKVRELDSPKTSGKHLDAVRAKWAEIVNDAYARAGHAVRVDHRSYKDRGMDRTSTVHLGPKASEIERRGVSSDLGNHNRAVQQENARRDALKAARHRVNAAIETAEEDGQRRVDAQVERETVHHADPAAILDAMTAKRATFSEKELDAMLRRSIHGRTERERLADAILAQPGVVALAEQPGGLPVRYTTQAVLQQEAEGLSIAAKLTADRTHAVECATMLAVAERAEFADMSREQYIAFVRCVGPEGLAVIPGEAGTGKSFTMRAICHAYEAEGGRVVGLAFTNKVIHDLRQEGFQETRTVAGALRDIAADDVTWDRRTVLMVDEAAMLATHEIIALAAKAQEVGAKLILVGDERQLGSAHHRGGLFGAICAQPGTVVSELSEIRRIRDTAPDAAGQRRAFNAMHQGRFREALEIFDTLGMVHWSPTQAEARAALAAHYARDVAARPGRRRFAFAHSNADAQALNEALRAVHAARGELGTDHLLPTKDGPAVFATSDRIQFTASAYLRSARAAGMVNGMVGTVRAIDGRTITVGLDGGKGQPERQVAFVVGEDGPAGQFNSFRHGYAGTIYKGQGTTVDDAYRLHSGAERAATSYVGNTCHTETLHLFVSQEAVRADPPWMGGTGGLPGLSAVQRDAAQRSYDAWTKGRPERARRHDLADYVAYVQRQWTPGKAHAAALDRLAWQMGRREEGRAASQFHRVARPAEPPPNRPLPPPVTSTPAVNPGARMREAAAPYIQAIRQQGAVPDMQRGGHPWWGAKAVEPLSGAKVLHTAPVHPPTAPSRQWRQEVTARRVEKARDSDRER